MKKYLVDCTGIGAKEVCVSWAAITEGKAESGCSVHHTVNVWEGEILNGIRFETVGDESLKGSIVSCFQELLVYAEENTALLTTIDSETGKLTFEAIHRDKACEAFTASDIWPQDNGRFTPPFPFRLMSEFYSDALSVAARRNAKEAAEMEVKD